MHPLRHFLPLHSRPSYRFGRIRLLATVYYPRTGTLGQILTRLCVPFAEEFSCEVAALHTFSGSYYSAGISKAAMISWRRRLLCPNIWYCTRASCRFVVRSPLGCPDPYTREPEERRILTRSRSKLESQHQPTSQSFCSRYWLQLFHKWNSKSSSSQILPRSIGSINKSKAGRRGI